MKKIFGLELQNAVLLEKSEMKKIRGGGTIRCANGSNHTTVNMDFFENAHEIAGYINALCGERGGSYINHP